VRLAVGSTGGLGNVTRRVVTFGCILVGGNDGDSSEDGVQAEGDPAAGEAAGLATDRGAVQHQAVGPRRRAVCLTGKRARPPEDCGGPWGYGNLLAALSDPTHEEHEELTEWVGINFDPAHFDAGAATEDMRSSRSLKRW